MKTTELTDFRITKELNSKIEYLLARQKLANEMVEKIQKYVNEVICVEWSKFNIIEIDTSNIYFTNNENIPIEELKTIVHIKVTFDKEYTHLKVKRMMELIGFIEYSNYPRFSFPNKTKNKNYKYTEPSNLISFEVTLSQ